MDPLIDILCKDATEHKLITPPRLSILREMLPASGTLDDFVSNAILFNICSDNDELVRRADDIKRTWAGLPAQDVAVLSREAVRPSLQGGDTLGLDWFSYYAMEAGGLTESMALSLAAEIDDVSDVLAFAQRVVDHWLTREYHKIQECVDKAMEKTAANEIPPRSIFGRTLIEEDY